MTKRIFDVTFATLGIILFLLPAIIIMIAIKCTSKGPTIFAQARIGRFGTIFTIKKFRTMHCSSEAHGFVTAAGDRRITFIGRILRRYKIDELPQLWNVFIGKMSFVGPRPDVPDYADKLTGEARKILELRPGITGPASLFFRKEEELLATVENPHNFNDNVIWPQKVQINLAYYYHWSFWKDIGYILVTIFPFLDHLFHLIPSLDENPGAIP